MKDTHLRIQSGNTPEYWANFVFYLKDQSEEIDDILDNMNRLFYSMSLEDKIKSASTIMDFMKTYLRNTYDAETVLFGTMEDLAEGNSDCYFDIIFPDEETLNIFMLKFA